MDHPNPYLKSFEWLNEHLGDPDLRIVDASWYLPAQNRDAETEYNSAHIPGAIFFDQDKIVDHASSLPHALPDPADFAKAVGALGINEDHTIVVYDGIGMFTAPRVWWMFRTMGASSVFVLDGGFDEWKSTGLPTSAEKSEFEAEVFTPAFDKDAVADMENVLEATKDDDTLILDARGEGRFYGRDPEPREGMRSGHMPSAINTPVFSYSDGGKLKSINDLKALFESNSVDLNKPVITTCGSGVTAAVITLALNSVGQKDVQLYDGSWSEWGSNPDTPIEK